MNKETVASAGITIPPFDPKTWAIVLSSCGVYLGGLGHQLERLMLPDPIEPAPACVTLFPAYSYSAQLVPAGDGTSRLVRGLAPFLLYDLGPLSIPAHHIVALFAVTELSAPNIEELQKLVTQAERLRPYCRGKSVALVGLG